MNHNADRDIGRERDRRDKGWKDDERKPVSFRYDDRTGSRSSRDYDDRTASRGSCQSTSHDYDNRTTPRPSTSRNYDDRTETRPSYHYDDRTTSHQTAPRDYESIIAKVITIDIFDKMSLLLIK